MKLIKNVDGDWTSSKQRLRQDLDTIQRNINQIQSQIDAPVEDTPADPAIISSANTVTVPTTDFLSVVSHDSTLSGDGTTTNPLKSNSSFTGVTTDAAGALSGVGTGGSPLAVKVDGTTIAINGSNQLALAAGGATYINVSVPIPSYRTLFSTPYTILAAPGAGKFIIPIVSVFYITKPGGSTGNTSPGIRFFYGPGANRWGQDVTPGMGTGFTYWYIQMQSQAGNIINDPTATPNNQALMLASTFDMGAGTAITTVSVGLLYTIMTLP